MSASDPVPNRSAKGCLTCRHRKKKCDEKKPQCERCLVGGFECLGYAHLGAARTSKNDKGVRTAQGSSSPAPDFSSLSNNQAFPPTTPSGSSLEPFPMLGNSVVGFYNPPPVTPLYEPKGIPRSLELDPYDLDNMKQLIMIEYARLARRVSFRPFPYPVELGLTNYLLRSSDVIYKTLYLGARISQALMDDTNWQRYIGSIDTFHNRILEAQSSLVVVNNNHLADRLAAHCRLAVFAFMISNSPIGYTIFRKGVPTFLQLAARFPELWKGDSAISLSHALHSSRHELGRFVVMDTIASLAFGIAPLVHYDTTIHPKDYNPDRFQFLEPVYAFPVVVLMTLARVNMFRVAGLVATGWDEAAMGIGECESAVRNWRPGLDYADQPAELVTRLAVQECWRQAALIYLYMGMSGVNCADSRVEPLVRQAAQLASTVEVGSPFETHLFIPCLIAGVAARKEKHRAIFRKKIQVSQKTEACLLRGADFVFVLDHLWHGVAAGGNPVTWDDYVNSRTLVLPVPMDV